MSAELSPAETLTVTLLGQPRDIPATSVEPAESIHTLRPLQRHMLTITVEDDGHTENDLQAQLGRVRSGDEHLSVGGHDYTIESSDWNYEGGRYVHSVVIVEAEQAPIASSVEARWRERLPEIEVPTLAVHGRRDPFFPIGNGEAIARAIPGARLLVLEEAATAIPDAAGEVAEAMVTLG